MIAPLFFVANLKDMVLSSGWVAQAVLLTLLCFSLFSWTLILSKWNYFSKARKQSDRFMSAFRKGPRAFELGSILDQFYPSPLCKVFEYGLAELSQQAGGGAKIKNSTAIQRALQIGASEESGRLESKLSWLATTASVCPFIGLLGTVIGIIQSFMDLSTQASTSLRTVGPGISTALVATAVGLLAAIPAAIFYNILGSKIRDIGTRMDDFALEFLNMAERSFGE